MSVSIFVFVSILVFILGAGTGFVLGTLYSGTRLPHVLAGLTPAQMEELARKVDMLRSEDELH